MKPALQPPGFFVRIEEVPDQVPQAGVLFHSQPRFFMVMSRRAAMPIASAQKYA
jgi:hypothetical protein